MSQVSAMGDPYEYRETMKAVFGMSDKTPEQVSAEFKARHDAEMRTSAGGPQKAPQAGVKPVPPSEMAKLAALMKNAKPRQQTPQE